LAVGLLHVQAKVRHGMLRQNGEWEPEALARDGPR
jgi:hypothetical protein